MSGRNWANRISSLEVVKEPVVSVGPCWTRVTSTFTTAQLMSFYFIASIIYNLFPS